MVIVDYFVVSGDMVSFGLKIAFPATASENQNTKVTLYAGTIFGCQVEYGRKECKSEGETKGAPEEARQGDSSQTA
jgi:hypothetical protein